ncbi:MAG: serine acetyltransferase [Sphingomonas fennica]
MQQSIHGGGLVIDLASGSMRAPLLRALSALFVHRGNWTMLVLIRLAQAAHASRNRFLGRYAARRLRCEFGSFVQPAAAIGPGLRLPHPNGIVIGGGVRIGARCTIFQQVTLGARRAGDGFGEAYPDIGDDVTIFAGAKLIGAVRIGDGAVIGANAVVVHDVPAGHYAVGVPAKTGPLGGAGS